RSVLFPLHVRSGAASGIPRATADVAVVSLSNICCKPLGPEPVAAFPVRAGVRELDATPSRQTRRVGEMLRLKNVSPDAGRGRQRLPGTSGEFVPSGRAARSVAAAANVGLVRLLRGRLEILEPAPRDGGVAWSGRCRR